MPINDPSSHAVIQSGSTGADVTAWQSFLAEQNLMAAANVDGDFGPRTKAATQSFQSAHGLSADGVVGPNSWNAAAALSSMPAATYGGDGWPALPPFHALTDAEREQVFGHFDYRAKPDGSGDIEILGTWQKDNITGLTLPQLAGVPFSWSSDPNNGRVLFHKSAVNQLTGLWAAWEKAGLKNQIISYGGAFNPRLQRGSTTALSNHSFGTAFDINVKENPLGQKPAARGTRGSVVDLVSIAHEFGFYWGGHFQKRMDGMHFEVAVLK